MFKKLLLITLVSTVAAFQDCLIQGKPELWLEAIVGVAYGMKGSYVETDCVSATVQLNNALARLIAALQWTQLQKNPNAAYHLTSYVWIQIGNVNVACELKAQLSQFDQRTNTSGGLGDLLYVVFNFPIQGFFQGKISKNPVKNQIWDALSALVAGWDLRRSMTCTEAGFEAGRIWQALLNFSIPDEMLYSKVSAAAT